jgi:glucokinase
LAIDIGGTKIAAGIVRPGGEVTLLKHIPTEAQQGGEAVMLRVINLAEQLTVEASSLGKMSALIAVGVGTAGQVTPGSGEIAFATSALPGWRGMPVRRRLETALGLPAFVENDANAMALGETYYGAGKGHRYVIGLTVGTGVGGGIVIDGRVYHGAAGFANNIGHLQIDYQGQRQCPCGRYGCMEAYASSGPLVQDFIDSIGVQRLQQELNLEPENMDVKQIADLARMGIMEAQGTIVRGARFLGIGIATLLNLINPEIVTIAGGIAQIGEKYFSAIRDTVLERAMPTVNQTPIVPAILGTNANLIGAACHAWQGIEKE